MFGSEHFTTFAMLRCTRLRSRFLHAESLSEEQSHDEVLISIKTMFTFSHVMYWSVLSDMDDLKFVIPSTINPLYENCYDDSDAVMCLESHGIRSCGEAAELARSRKRARETEKETTENKRSRLVEGCKKNLQYKGPLNMAVISRVGL